MLIAATTFGQAPSQKFEQGFLDSFPMHHQEAIEMSNLCVEKATHQQLKSLCQHMATSQTDEKQQMQSWFQSWYGGKGMAPMTDMAKMKAQHELMMAKLHATSGEKFDHAMMVSMGEHHRMGIADTQKCVAQAVHPELKALCGKMEAEQTDDLSKMSSWIKSWK
ncbi:DUF305 domain-containing protein [Terriglobus aquaticus]|uniref:DUF305 domain-containing protein n=1 Tax=Terriglobus aquaticus TaxID=940139 RepID=A0ABW9KRQ3_9BACT